MHEEFATGDIPGFVHLYAGEEASATGVCSHLDDRDAIASTHRGHGHCIAKGVDVHGDDGRDLRQGDRLLPRQGRLDAHRRPRPRACLGANGIVGGGPPLICGRALASEDQGRWWRRGRVLRRRRVQPGHHAGVAEPGVDLEPACGLRRGEQRLRGGDVVDLVGRDRRHRRPGRGVRDPRRDRRRVRLLRRARGGG